MNRLLFSSCLLVILTLSHVDPQLVSTGDLRLLILQRQKRNHLPTSPVKLPIRLYWGYLVIVEGSIGNVQKLKFPGGHGGLPKCRRPENRAQSWAGRTTGRVNLSNKSVQTRLVVLPSLLLGPVRAEALPVLTEDLSFFQKASATRWMGLWVWMS